MSEFVDRLVALVIDRIENEADAIGVDMVADIRAKISTPVIYGELGDITRSPPFEYPWLETGHLQRSERHEIQSSPNTVRLTIINDAEYARRLHDGHDDVEPRPFHDLALPEWVPQIRERIRDAIIGKR